MSTNTTYVIKPKQEKVLVIEREGGDPVRLVLLKRTKDNIEEITKQNEVCEQEFKDKKISIFEYQVKQIEILLKECPPDFFRSLELDDIVEIGKLVGALFNPPQANSEDKKKES